MEKFGRLTILSKEPTLKDKSGYYRTLVKCRCDCGNIKVYRLSDLKSGKTISCGCFHKEIVTIHDDGTKGRKHYYIYQMWHSMMKRCYNLKSKPYKDYGGRGIKVFEPFKEYNIFKNWIIENLGERPEKHSLDRIDNDGNYQPNNLRWSTMIEQNKNRRIITNI